MVLERCDELATPDGALSAWDEGEFFAGASVEGIAEIDIPKHEPTHNLLRLPFGVRLQIYSHFFHVFPTSRRINAHAWTFRVLLELRSLLFTCHQLQEEALKFSYENSTFILHLSYGMFHYPNENYINSVTELSHLK